MRSASLAPHLLLLVFLLACSHQENRATTVAPIAESSHSAMAWWTVASHPHTVRLRVSGINASGEVAPIVGANVQMPPGSAGKGTSVTGEVTFADIRPGQYELLVRAIGYKAVRAKVRVTPEAGVEVVATLAPDVIFLDDTPFLSGCVARDSNALRERLKYADIATGVDPASANLRKMYHLPVVADSAVELVQDLRTCSLARDALNKDQNTPALRQRQVLVIRVGTVFVVSDRSHRLGEFETRTIFDAHFTRVLARFAG